MPQVTFNKLEICFEDNLSLPLNFADKVLELELKMEEENIKHEDILKLTELYAV